MCTEPTRACLCHIVQRILLVLVAPPEFEGISCVGVIEWPPLLLAAFVQ